MPTPDIFPCSQCGECCRHIDLIPQLAQFNRGDGVCIHLHGNLCEIYENRPEICNVDAMFKNHFSMLCSKEDFYQLNLKVCHLLRKEEP